MKRALCMATCLVAVMMLAVPYHGSAQQENDFPKEGKAKMTSLGKTEKDKLIVCTDLWRNDHYMQVFVVQKGEEDEEGEEVGWYSRVYHFYYDTERGKRNYASYLENGEAYYEEHSATGLWILTAKSASYSSWQEAYDKYKENGNTFVE